MVSDYKHGMLLQRGLEFDFKGPPGGSEASVTLLQEIRHSLLMSAGTRYARDPPYIAVGKNARKIKRISL